MKNAAQLQEALDRYRQLCREVERLKYRLVGGDSFPVNDQDWEAWKQQHLGRAMLRVHPAFPPESCDNLNYHQLLVVYEEMLDVWCDIKGDAESDYAQQALIEEVIKSFPSLEAVAKSLNPWIPFYEILDRGETSDPQAFYAARFVEALRWYGRSGQWVDHLFYVDRAFVVWDLAHKEAFIRWTTMPFFLPYGFFTPSVTPPKV